MFDKINKEFLYARISQADIFCRFFPLNEINFKKLYKNPLRDDSDAGCSFYYSDSNILYFHDFAWKHFDCIEFVKQSYGVGYFDACFIIAEQFNLLDNITSTKTFTKLPYSKQPTELRVLKKRFTKSELEFWLKYDNSITITDLENSHIHSLKTAWLNGKQIYTHKADELAFYYHLSSGYNYQLYNPNKFYAKIKFIQSSNKFLIGEQFIDYDCDYLLISKSFKCWFCEKRFNINTTAILSESIIIPKKVIDRIQKIKFEKTGKYFILLTLFDNDYKGKKASILYKKEHNTIPLLFPANEEKDFSDNLAKFGKYYMVDYITEIKNQLNL
jgi:hypothetical protein